MNELYDRLGRQFTALIEDEQDFIANCANCCALLMSELEGLNWVGFYFVRDGELVLGPFQGMPACTRIGWGEGVCGTVAEIEESIIVPDVHAFPGHIACDAASCSELVVPLLWQGQVLGVLDLDSPQLDRFQDEDREGVEAVVAILLGGSDLWSAFGSSG
ncbi:MAG: GAF domain-containing protein [Pseudomonadales bacterium]|nr:GAF domain-containing protein [Pseudomonadales bacterium]